MNAKVKITLPEIAPEKGQEGGRPQDQASHFPALSWEQALGVVKAILLKLPPTLYNNQPHHSNRPVEAIVLKLVRPPRGKMRS